MYFAGHSYTNKWAIKILLISVVIAATLAVHKTNYDENCYLSNNDVLQVAFVVDRTYSTAQVIFTRIAEIIPKIESRLNYKYTNSEFAITLFADWEDDALPSGIANRLEQNKTYRHGNKTHGCYFRYLKFTQDSRIFSEYVKKMQGHVINGGGDGWADNSLSALAITVSDPKLGWNRSPTDFKGRNVHRYVILLTDGKNTKRLGNPGNRKPFRGDGSDTCETSLPATYDELASVFDKYKINVIAMLNDKFQKDILTTYEKYFSEINNRRKVEYCSAVIAVRATADTFADKLTLCIKGALKCAFSDPPSYNTLGL